MAELVQSPGNPQGQRRSIEDVRKVASDFLKQQPDVRRANVTKLVQIDPEAGTWEAEAELYVPNAIIRA